MSKEFKFIIGEEEGTITIYLDEDADASHGFIVFEKDRVYYQDENYMKEIIDFQELKNWLKIFIEARKIQKEANEE